MITGASSFLGEALINRFSASGHQIIGLSRRRPKVQNIYWIPWSFKAPIEIRTLPEIKCVIHLAHDYRVNEGAHLSIEGTKQVFELFAKCGAEVQLYISSYSAGPHAIATYGKIKFELEQFFSAQTSGIVIRPGLILGNGGLHGRMVSWIQKYHFAVLPDGGRGQIAVVHLERVTEVIHDLCSKNTSQKFYNAFEPNLVSLKNLVMEKQGEGTRTLVISLPSKLLYSILKLLSFFRFKLPVTHENLAGFMQNQACSMQSDLPSSRVEKP